MHQNKAANQESQKRLQFIQALVHCNQVRDGDIETFFAHENHPWPPSLADQGKLRLPTKKSDLPRLFNDGTTPEPPSYFDVKLVAIVHFLSCEQVSTFAEYSNNVFNAWVGRELQSCDRVDIIWDIYKAKSIEECTRQKRVK